MEQVLHQLPKGWINVQVKDVTKSLSSGFACNKSFETTDGYVHLRTHNISTSGCLNFNQMIKVSHDKIEEKKSKIFKGEILFNNTNSKELVGKTAYVDQDYDFAFSNHLTKIVPNDKVHSKFLVYWLVSLQTSGYFNQICKKWIGQAGVNNTVLKGLTVPLPSKEEQKRIVEKLDALLTRIDTAIEHLQESLTLKSSLLQSALDGHFTSITERMTIESLAEVKGGKRLPKGEKLSDEETEHPYIRVADFTDKGTIDLSGIKYISKEIHEQIKRYVISKDDLYISIAGTIGKTGFVPSELHGANLTENAAKLVIKDKQKLDLSYLYLFTLTSDFSAQAGLATKTVAQPKLALTRLSKIEIPMCSLEEQLSLVSTIETLKSKIHDAETVLLGKIEDLKSLKASILDSAFKGEL